MIVFLPVLTYAFNVSYLMSILSNAKILEVQSKFSSLTFISCLRTYIGYHLLESGKVDVGFRIVSCISDVIQTKGTHCEVS
jgi:hypothetical protein